MQRTVLAGLVLVGCALANLTCMLPRGSMVAERAHHANHHATLLAAHGPACLPERLERDPATSSPRPDPKQAATTFRGDVYGMREHVYFLEGGEHAYLERWALGVPGDWHIVRVGYDWKTSCRIETCDLPDGTRCCYQECSDGGSSGMGYEAPDRFGCMNHEAGGIFQWFLDGLDEAGVPGLEGCGFSG